MFVIVWEFRVPSDRVPEFERAYGADGEWAVLFRRGAGFLGTELLRDRDDPERFFTIDRWREGGDFEAFRATFGDDYAAVDKRCELLTVSETRIGVFESADRP